MYKLISMLVVFLLEVVFDSKEEYDVTSPKFSMRKMFVFITVILLSVTTGLLGERVVSLAKTNMNLQEENKRLSVKINHPDSSDVRNDTPQETEKTPVSVVTEHQ